MPTVPAGKLVVVIVTPPAVDVVKLNVVGYDELNCESARFPAVSVQPGEK